MKTENIKLLIDFINKTGPAVIKVENALKNKDIENFNDKLETARKLVQDLKILRMSLEYDQTFWDRVKNLFGIGLLAKCDRDIKKISKEHKENEIVMAINEQQYS